MNDHSNEVHKRAPDRVPGVPILIKVFYAAPGSVITNLEVEFDSRVKGWEKLYRAAEKALDERFAEQIIEQRKSEFRHLRALSESGVMIVKAYNAMDELKGFVTGSPVKCPHQAGCSGKAYPVLTEEGDIYMACTRHTIFIPSLKD